MMIFINKKFCHCFHRYSPTTMFYQWISRELQVKIKKKKKTGIPSLFLPENMTCYYYRKNYRWNISVNESIGNI